jgi:hypothetical protein
MRKLLATFGITAVAATGISCAACSGSASQSPHAASVEACKVLFPTHGYTGLTQASILKASNIAPDNALGQYLTGVEYSGNTTITAAEFKLAPICAAYHVGPNMPGFRDGP